MIGDAGAPDILIGGVDFKIVDKESGWIAGVLLNAAGQRVGKVWIEGLPLHKFEAIKGPGRPSAKDKHLAVLLAWVQKLGELGGERKAGAADKATAEQFSFLTSDGEGNEKTVRDIRGKQATKFGLDLSKDTFHIMDDLAAGEGPPVCSILIEKTTIYETDGGRLEILGASAIAWAAEMGAHVKRLPAVRLVIPSDGPAAWKARNGPKIISIIRPGR